MFIMDGCDCNGIIRTERKHPPAHYLMEIKTYTSLASIWAHGFQSAIFDAAGYKWSLVFYPLGKNQEGKQISLYLQIEETEDLPIGWELLVSFKLFVQDQINDKYLIIQDVRDEVKRFYPAKRRWGFDELLPMETFKDIENGYLVDGRCLFGAEVFVVQRTGQYEIVRSLTPSENIKSFTWKLENFSRNTKSVSSKVFTVHGTKWNLEASYVGRGLFSSENDDEYVSLHLVSGHENLESGVQLSANFTLRVKDQIDSNHIERRASSWFCGEDEDFGWEKFATVREVERCICDNSLIVECDITHLTVVTTEGV